MKKIPPFTPNSNDDVHCVQAVYRMVLKHYLNRNFSWKQIDAIAHARADKGTWTFPLDTALVRLGIHVTNIENTDYQRLYKEGVTYLREVNGEKNADYYITRSNISSVIHLIPEFLRTVPHESRKATIYDITSGLKAGKLVGAEVNASRLNRQDGHALHFVLLYQANGKNLIFHDPGLPPYPARTVSIRQFMKCFAYPGAGQAIEIFSKV